MRFNELYLSAVLLARTYPEVESSAFGVADLRAIGHHDIMSDYQSFMRDHFGACQGRLEAAFELNPDEKCEVSGLSVILDGGRSMRLDRDDFIVAKVKRDMSSFCNKRVMYQYLSGIEGIAAKEAVVVSGIPKHCIDRVVVYERLGRFDMRTTDDSTAYRVAADAIELLGRLHESGFIHRSMFSQPFLADREGRMKLGELVSVVAFSDARSAETAYQLVKNDISSLLDGDLKDLIGRKEVFVFMHEDMRKMSPALANSFAYRYWADVLRRLASGEGEFAYPDALIRHHAVDDTSLVRHFNYLNRRCLEGLPEPIPACPKDMGCFCPPKTEFTVAELGPLRIDRPTAARGDFSGVYGNVFRMSDERSALMKVFFNFEKPEMLCSEKSMLSALNGLGGLTPKQYEIIDGVHEACKIKSFVMEQAGSDDVDIRDSLWDLRRAPFYRIFARTLEVLEILHNAGFIHGDTHIDNIKIDSLESIESSLKLIDFGLARPYVDEEGRHLVEPDTSRRVDMERFAQEIAEAGGSRPEFVNQFIGEMAALEREERPNYRKWIEIFRSRALELK